MGIINEEFKSFNFKPIKIKVVQPRITTYKDLSLPYRYIINQNACICFWQDGTKTISKRHENDVFDKELGFLFACWQYYNKHLTKNVRKRIIDCIKYDQMKVFLFEKFKVETKMSTLEARRFLDNLKVEELKTGEAKRTIHTDLSKDEEFTMDVPAKRRAVRSRKEK